ncbi:MAG: methyltransferase domain-containing protein [Chloroflexota bacterium]|nr:MAG: methyltransferase domain-containing protein [Chloroflexota bacterium]
MIPDQESDLKSIRSYYDHNTKRFLSYGKQRRTRTIHRQVWGKGVQTEEQALHFVHQLILAESNSLQPEQSRSLEVLDLGCGVGASLFYLAKNIGGNFSGLGLTISPLQAHQANEEAEINELASCCKFIVGDFLSPPIRKKFDLIYSIEAFAHAYNPQAYFQVVKGLIKPGGRLILCDDFLDFEDGQKLLSKDHQFWLDAFRHGWQVKSVISSTKVVELAAGVHLIPVKLLDLTPMLRLRPLPTRIFRLLSGVITAVASGDVYWQSVTGGQALQLCLANGLVAYRYLVFENQSQENP